MRKRGRVFQVSEHSPFWKFVTESGTSAQDYIVVDDPIRKCACPQPTTLLSTNPPRCDECGGLAEVSAL